MSAQHSDTDSSYGWTIITNKGSDIETAPEHEDVLEYPHLGKDTASNDGSLDGTVEDKTLVETVIASEVGGGPEVTDEGLLCFSDHSDIVSLDYLKESRNAEDDNEDVYFGEASSSQYTFITPNTGELPAVAHSSSSEDQGDGSSIAVVRRRRTRRNTASTIGRDEESDYDGVITPAVPDPTELDVLNSPLLVILLIVVSMTVYCLLAPFLASKVRFPEDHGKFTQVRPEELQEIWELLQTHITVPELLQLDDHKVFSLLVRVLQKVHKENQDFQALQDQRSSGDDLGKRESQERTNHLLEQQRLSLSSMQEELKSLHSKIQHPPMKRVVACQQSENKRLKFRLARETQMRRSLDERREELLAEVQALKSKLLNGERVRGVLTHKMVGLRTKKTQRENELQELKSQLATAEERLVYEQHRSDMWERLYVEATAREKGDSDSKWDKSESVVKRLKGFYEKAKEALKVKFRKLKDSFNKAGPHFGPFESYYTRKPSDQSSEEQRWQRFNPFSFRGTDGMVRADEVDLLLQNYLRDVGLSHNWAELKMFISKFFRNGLFVHQQMPFRDFISRVKSHLAHLSGYDSKHFQDLDLYINF